MHGGHLFYDYFLQAWGGGAWPLAPPPPPWIRYWIKITIKKLSTYANDELFQGYFLS